MRKIWLQPYQKYSLLTSILFKLVRNLLSSIAVYRWGKKYAPYRFQDQFKEKPFQTRFWAHTLWWIRKDKHSKENRKICWARSEFIWLRTTRTSRFYACVKLGLTPLTIYPRMLLLRLVWKQLQEYCWAASPTAFLEKNSIVNKPQKIQQVACELFDIADNAFSSNSLNLHISIILVNGIVCKYHTKWIPV